jgi:hypothetical protein
VEHNLWKQRREDVIARLQAHAAQGAQVYIASSLVEPMIEPFAERIGAQTIGTPVEYTNGQVRVAGDLVAQERKIGQVLSRLNVERVDFAYGDTEQDIPLLEHAGHPVAVYPDEKLKAVALERGWEIWFARKRLIKEVGLTSHFGGMVNRCISLTAFCGAILILAHPSEERVSPEYIPPSSLYGHHRTYLRDEYRLPPDRAWSILNMTYAPPSR